jgi:HAD superfamily hydrolase (TIGR01509 family)
MSAWVRAALFDLDGTLADSEHVAAAALSAAFAQAGLDGDPPLEEFLAMSGMALEEILARLGLPAGLAGPFRSAALEMTGLTRLFPGVLPLLRVLRARGVGVGVITGKDRARTLAVLDHLEIGGLIGAVVTPDDPPAPKPSPEGVWWLCRQLGVAPQHAVLAGDGVADLRAGADAGVRTVACLWGAGRPGILARQAPWQTASTVGELAVLLDGLTVAAAAAAAGAGPAVTAAFGPAGAVGLSANIWRSDG